VLDTILFGLKILLLILLYLFIFRVARAAGRDLAETAEAASAPPRALPDAPLGSVGSGQMGAQAVPVVGATLDGPEAAAFAADERDVRRAGRESERSGEAGPGMMAHVRPRLIVERSPVLDEGTELELHGWLTIGRSSSSDLPLDDGFVSSTHARIVPRGESFYVEDLGSTNGTFVNEKRVTEAQLRPAARVRIGETVLRYEE
jgi:FHA domain